MVLYEQRGRSRLGSRKHEEAIIFFNEVHQLAPEPETKIPRRKAQNEGASKQKTLGVMIKKPYARKTAKSHMKAKVDAQKDQPY